MICSEKIRDLILGAEFSKNIAKEIQTEFVKLKTNHIIVRSGATVEDLLC